MKIPVGHNYLFLIIVSLSFLFACQVSDGSQDGTATAVDENSASADRLVDNEGNSDNSGQSGLETDPSSAYELPPMDGKTIEVADNSELSSALANAREGDILVLSPGTYSGTVQIDKRIMLTSRYHTTGDPQYVAQTVIQSASPDLELIGNASGAIIKGLTFKGGNNGVKAYVEGTYVVENRFENIGKDSMSLEDVGGIIHSNVFISGAVPSDDAIDADGPGKSLIANNEIRDYDDDGIEIRNFDYNGPLLTVEIRNNYISGSGEDAIQIIDYPADSARRFIIANNLLKDSFWVGLGLMSEGDTVEDPSKETGSADVSEKVHVFGNTIVGNKFGISGGDNMVVVNNIIADNQDAGVYEINGDSQVAHNLFYNNGVDAYLSNVDEDTTMHADPKLNADFTLQSTSPAIDAGTAEFDFQNEPVLNIAGFSGAAPDLGAFEFVPQK